MSDSSTAPSSRRSVAPVAHSRSPRSGSGCEGIDVTGARDRGKLKFNDQLTVATWNCGGLFFTTREACKDYCDILALTETHDNGVLKGNRLFITGEPAPPNDPYAGVSFLLSERVAKCVIHKGSLGPRITNIKVKCYPLKPFCNRSLHTSQTET